ncbi:MAG: TIGR03085 family metal-binding protein [Actinomycetota bacterium]|nr:TIGR03085 family metal-binding protein [Actinomycetota bacterium]
MAPSAPHRAEREALCNLMIALGPDAPTLCQGWSTGDLAVHLVIRERKLLAATGIVFGGPFAMVLRRATNRMKLEPYPNLVETIQFGPPLWLRPFDSAMNLMEFYVHHEDIRRGNGDTTPRPESETAQIDDALWKLLGRSGRLLTRKMGSVGLTLRRSDRSHQTEVTAHTGSPVATMSGRPGELVLYLMGRKSAANIKLEGPMEAIDAVTSVSFGI